VTAIYPKAQSIIYPALGLAGEAGEVAEKVKKWIRDGNLDRDAIAKELGDVMWYIAAMATDLDLDLDRIADMNIQKLADREMRGKIRGSGDDR
jgi:NTP pyrophosphatase (non-canonical NTP hydrolase)